MHLKINDELIPIAGAYINLLYANPQTQTPGVFISCGFGKWRLEGEPAETARAFFSTLEKLGHIANLNTAFKQSPGPSPPSPKLKILKRPLPTPCPLLEEHSSLTIPCPACKTPPIGLGKPQVASETLPPWDGSFPSTQTPLREEDSDL